MLRRAPPFLSSRVICDRQSEFGGMFIVEHKHPASGQWPVQALLGAMASKSFRNSLQEPKKHFLAAHLHFVL